MSRIFGILFAVLPGALMLGVIVLWKPPYDAQIHLTRDWSRFSPADRASCLRLTGSGGKHQTCSRASKL